MRFKRTIPVFVLSKFSWLSLKRSKWIQDWDPHFKQCGSTSLDSNAQADQDDGRYGRFASVLDSYSVCYPVHDSGFFTLPKILNYFSLQLQNSVYLVWC